MKRLIFRLLLCLIPIAQVHADPMPGISGDSTWGEFLGRINEFRREPLLTVAKNATSVDEAMFLALNESVRGATEKPLKESQKPGDFVVYAYRSYKLPGTDSEIYHFAVHSDDGVTVFIKEVLDPQHPENFVPDNQDRPVLAKFNAGQPFPDLSRSFNVAKAELKGGHSYNIWIFYSNTIWLGDATDFDGMSAFIFPVMTPPYIRLLVDNNMDGKLDLKDVAARKEGPVILDVNNDDTDRDGKADNEDDVLTEKDRNSLKLNSANRDGHEFPNMRLLLSRNTFSARGTKLILHKKDVEPSGPQGTLRVFYLPSIQADKTLASDIKAILGTADADADITEAAKNEVTSGDLKNPAAMEFCLEAASYGVVSITADLKARSIVSPEAYIDTVLVEGDVDRYFFGPNDKNIAEVQPLKGGEQQRPVYAGGELKLNNEAGNPVDAVWFRLKCPDSFQFTRFNGRLRDSNDKRIIMSTWLGLGDSKAWIQCGMKVVRDRDTGKIVNKDGYLEIGSTLNGVTAHADIPITAAIMNSEIILLRKRTRSTASTLMLLGTPQPGGGTKWEQHELGIPSPNKGPSEPWKAAFLKGDLSVLQMKCELPFTTSKVPGTKANPLQFSEIKYGRLANMQQTSPSVPINNPKDYVQWVTQTGYVWDTIGAVSPRITVPTGRQKDDPKLGGTYHFRVESKPGTVLIWDQRER